MYAGFVPARAHSEELAKRGISKDESVVPSSSEPVFAARRLCHRHDEEQCQAGNGSEDEDRRKNVVQRDRRRHRMRSCRTRFGCNCVHGFEFFQPDVSSAAHAVSAFVTARQLKAQRALRCVAARCIRIVRISNSVALRCLVPERLTQNAIYEIRHLPKRASRYEDRAVLRRALRRGHAASVFLWMRPSFTISFKVVSGSAMSSIFSSGLPSITRMSANAPASIRSNLPG